MKLIKWNMLKFTFHILNGHQHAAYNPKEGKTPKSKLAYQNNSIIIFKHKLVMVKRSQAQVNLNQIKNMISNQFEI